jgi:SAM-dependent methyltransferase
MSKHALLQTPEEWSQRNIALANSLSELLVRFASAEAKNAIDIGCQRGLLTDALAASTGLAFRGIDPVVSEPRLSAGGTPLVHGWSNAIPFEGGAFDCAILANVYEHIPPRLRQSSLLEIRRVLAPGGILVGQLPNPHFPIEAHSRLPFMGWLPRPLKSVYWRLSPVAWELDFFSVTIGDLRRTAIRSGYRELLVRSFAYPIEAVPNRVRPIARVAMPITRLIPWAWQFVFIKVD